MDSEDQRFKLFCLLHGEDRHSPLAVAQIPKAVSGALRWNARNVFVTVRDVQKIRHHPMHGMDAVRGLFLPLVIQNGDYYKSDKRGHELQIEAVLHELDRPQRVYFLVLSRNREDTGIFIRTFYFNSAMSRNKMKGARVLLRQSTTTYFK